MLWLYCICINITTSVLTMVNFDCLEKPLLALFKRYGKFIAYHPIPFLILPIFLTTVMGAGMFYLEKTTDIEELFTPTNGRAKDERDFFEGLFLHGDNITADRLTTLGRFGRLIIAGKDGGNVLHDDALVEIRNLSSVINNISVPDQDGNGRLTFEDICLQRLGNCNTNFFFDIFPGNSVLADVNLTYPVYYGVFVGGIFGGAEFEDGTNIVIKATVIQLNYYLGVDNEVADRWEDAFLETMASYNGNTIEVFRYTSRSIELELESASDSVFFSFTIAFTIIINFAVWTSIRLDNVQNKPWLALMGVMAAGFAVVSAFGLLMYCGVPFIDIVATTPILILSIGVDDMFIMIASWRKTNIRAPVEERMGEAMSEAALSITITTVTDALAFGVGVLTVFPSVQIFCAYTGLAVIFAYIYQVTFFAACMAISGKRENSKRHYLTCSKVRPKDESPSTFYAVCCSGGPSRKKNDGSRENSPHVIMIFFRDYFGPFVTQPATKSFTIFVYLTYVGFSIWGILGLQQGIELQNLAMDDSYVAPYYNSEVTYFRKYGPIVSVAFPKELNTLSVEANENFLTLLDTFEDSDFTYSKNLSVCWLRSFIGFLEIRNIPNDSYSEILLNSLKRDFLLDPYFKQFSMDLVFEADGAISASRCLVLSKDIDTPNREQDMMSFMRDAADQSHHKITVYHPGFVFFDQYTAVLPNTLQNLGIALVVMLIVSLVFIPQPICSLWVVFCILSIEAGVVGFMSHWNVSLDSISMINIILCIGFSVDFSAHVAYTFTISQGPTKNSRIVNTLFTLGMPILQGGLSTVLGISVLSTSDSYIFRSFFKTLFLVIVLGLIHSMFFLPVFLTFLGGSSKNDSVDSASDRNDETAQTSTAHENQAYDMKT